MDKQTIKGFLAWLDSASEDSILERKKLFLETMKKVGTPEGRSDIRLGLRLIDEELIARLDLSKAQQAQR
ncbi:MAG: hypothetical protein OEL20_05230 [Sulfuritalea sp.]|nr:hypothetical protein [Sulfuritalea sp.]